MYRLTPDAADDLERITNYIGARNPQGALSVLEKLLAKFEALGNSPHSGTQRPDMGKTARVVPCGSYVIYFRPEGSGVMILRVFHGARNVRNLNEK